MKETRMEDLVLSPREADVVDAIVEHGCQKTAARILGLHEHTIAKHLDNARRKAGVSNTVRLAVLWDRYSREF